MLQFKVDYVALALDDLGFVKNKPYSHSMYLWDEKKQRHVFNHKDNKDKNMVQNTMSSAIKEREYWTRKIKTLEIGSQQYVEATRILKVVNKKVLSFSVKIGSRK
jgi:ABC-type sugar transport system ATPase subunit